MFASIITADKSLELIGGADHYGRTLGPHGAPGARVSAGTDAVVRWMLKRFPPDGAPG